MVLLRDKLFIDGDVQGTLLRRAALYSVACALYFGVILVFTESMSDPDQSIGESIKRCLDEAIYWFPGLATLAPLVAYDILRVTNRFTGPIFRLRREMRRLSDGEKSQVIVFRDDDYWNDMAELFNQIREELTELREAKKQAAAASTAGDVPVQPRLFTNDGGDQEISDDLLTTSKA